MLPSNINRSKNKHNSMPPEIFTAANCESNEPKSTINLRKTSIINTNDDAKLINQKINNHTLEEDPSLRVSIFSMNEDQSYNPSKLISKSAVFEMKEDKNNEELNITNDDLESESHGSAKVQIEKINFTDMIKNKILKINILPLCSDFKNYFDVDKFSQFIDEYMKIKIFKFSLKNIKIPPFRNVMKNSFDNVELTKTNLIIFNMIPISRSKNRFIIMIGFLILIGVLLIVFVVILLIRN